MVWQIIHVHDKFLNACVHRYSRSCHTLDGEQRTQHHTLLPYRKLSQYESPHDTWYHKSLVLKHNAALPEYNSHQATTCPIYALVVRSSGRSELVNKKRSVKLSPRGKSQACDPFQSRESNNLRITHLA